MFHGVIQKITLAQFFLRHGVYWDPKQLVSVLLPHAMTGNHCRAHTIEGDQLQNGNHSGLPFWQIFTEFCKMIFILLMFQNY